MKRLPVLSVMAALLIAIPLAAEQGPEPRKDNHPRKSDHWAALNLTQDQKDRLKALRGEARTSGKAHFEQVRSVREKMKEELLKAAPNQGVLDGHAEGLAKLHREMTSQHIAHLLKVKTILTPEQFQTLVSQEGFGPRRGKGGPGGATGPGCEGKGGKGCMKNSGDTPEGKCPRQGQEKQ